MLGKPLKWVSELLGGREIEKRVEEDFPSWQEFSEQKLRDAEEERNGLPIDLPAHRVHISSPLQWNFLYFLVVAGSLALGYAQPEWAPIFVYSAILIIFGVAVIVIARDGIFFHFEGQRLEEDGDMINQNASGPDEESQPEKNGGFLNSLTGRKKSLFQSRLFQIHYQNVLRTFEQGNRRTWVNQESSITDIHTLLSQRGMKLVWTFIEVLPQLGLLGTLIGLARMFLAFSSNATVPETSIIAGFGTALGTTILANLFVLILRPLYMRNERAMNEILSTLQMLMAMFILPTQQHVLERPGVSGSARPASSGPGMALLEQGGQAQLAKSMTQLTHALETYSGGGHGREESGMAQDVNGLSQELKGALKALKDGGSPVQVNFQQASLDKLTQAMQALGRRIDGVLQAGAQQKGGVPQSLEHDLMQMRLMNHDTLVLLEKIADRLGSKEEVRNRLLSSNPMLRSRVFPEHAGERGPGGEPGGPPRQASGSGLGKIKKGR